jgi:hypothetical protein
MATKEGRRRVLRVAGAGAWSRLRAAGWWPWSFGLGLLATAAAVADLAGGAWALLVLGLVTIVVAVVEGVTP